MFARLDSNVSAFERTGSDTTGPLSAVPLSRVGDELHRAGSIAWEADAAMVHAFLGAPAPRGHERPRRPSLRLGTRLDSTQPTPTRPRGPSLPRRARPPRYS